MKTKEFLKNIQKSFDDAFEILERKNSDYANDDDPFYNFKMTEYFNITDAEKGILVRLTDKFSRISNLIDRENKVKDEKLEDTILDMINYLAILKALIESRKDE